MADDYRFETDDGLQREPARVLVYGPEGVGKTTWATGARVLPWSKEVLRPILVSMERGTGHIKGIPRMRRPGAASSEVDSWDYLAWCVRALIVGKHDRHTLVLDTATAAERLAVAAVCQALSVKSIEDVGYGKGYVYLTDRIVKLVSALTKLGERRGMDVIVVAHSRVKNFSNPDGPDYNRYAIALDDRVSEVFRQWATTVAFMRFRESVETEGKEGKGKKGKQKVARDRELYVIRSDGKEAKNRYDLPETMSAEDPSEFWSAVDAFWSGSGASPARVAEPQAEASPIAGDDF